jgi:hypothetical protein
MNPDDLRVRFVTYADAKELTEKLDAIFAHVRQAFWDVSDRTPADIERVLARMTKGQRVMLAVEQLEMEVYNGGFDQYFFNSASGLAREALEGLKLLRVDAFTSLLERAIAFYPEGDVPRDRKVRQRLLLGDVRDRLEKAKLDTQWYKVQEDLSKALFAYVDAHPGEFFLDR